MGKARKKVLKIASEVGIGCGLHVVHPGQEVVQKALMEGFSFLALGCDMILLDQAAKETLKMAKNIIDNKGEIK